jgi:GTP diphosphokinase / guanosine-3',5'-bis(diphosphate) 3'-diphosphatase
MKNFELYQSIKGDDRIKKSVIELIEMCPRPKSVETRDFIVRAFNFAYVAHEKIKRKSGEPYIIHPLEVAKIAVRDIGLGITSAVSALLHDTVEDCDEISIELIREKFGNQVASIVDGLTKIPVASKSQTSEQAVNFRRMLMSIPQDLRVILIKFADRLHNMRTLDGMSVNRQIAIAGETLYIYAPLARRLGLNKIGRELEDLSFRYHAPEDFRRVMDAVEKSQPRRDQVFMQFAGAIRDRLSLAKYKYELKTVQKSLYATWKRMTEDDLDIEDFNNFQSIRLIFKPKPKSEERAQCFDIFTKITEVFEAKEGSIHDWVINPRSNNFEALIAVILIGQGNWREIQILSTRMAELAERGYSSEKPTGKENGPTQRDKWIEEIGIKLRSLENHDQDFIETINLGLYIQEIYVNTPAGEYIKLPKNASVLDFAFHIHTELGFKCMGAKVNRKPVSINHKLESGDMVEIIDSPTTKPTREWLDYVVSPRAKDALKAYFRKEERDLSLDGEKIIKEVLSDLSCQDFDAGINRISAALELTVTDLLQHVGKGLISKKQIEKAYKPDSPGFLTRFFGDKFWPNAATDPAPAAYIFDSKKPFEAVESVTSANYILADCCNPVPGDKAIAHNDEYNQITIHQISCKNAQKILSGYGKSVAVVNWRPHKMPVYPARIYLSGLDRSSVVFELAYIISRQMNVYIKAFNLEVEANIYKGTITLHISNLDVLNALIKKIRVVKGVTDVRRVPLH